jgi:hypothetical protein
LVISRHGFGNIQACVFGISRHGFWEHTDVSYGNIQRRVLGISRHVFWEYLDIGLGISRHEFWEHPDVSYGDIQRRVLRITGHGVETSHVGFGNIQTLILKKSAEEVSPP